MANFIGYSEHVSPTDKPVDSQGFHEVVYHINRKHEIYIYNSHNTTNIQIDQMQIPVCNKMMYLSLTGFRNHNEGILKSYKNIIIWHVKKAGAICQICFFVEIFL